MEIKEEAFKAVNDAMNEWIKKSNPTTERNCLEAQRAVDIILCKQETANRKASVKVKTR